VFWLILTVGAQGAGKLYMVEHLLQDHRLPLQNPVIVDMDEIRRRLPEYTWFLEQVPDRLDELTKQECGYISETLMCAALQQGRNVIFDSCLLDGRWYADFIDSIREEHGNLVKIGMIRVDASMDKVLERASALANETGRTWSKETIQSQLEALNRSIGIVEPIVDKCFEIQNDDNLILKSASWSEFNEAFSPSSLCDQPVNDIFGRRQRSRKSKRGSFVAFLSTEDNYRLDALEFRGAFADIRKHNMDYVSWTKAR
jgi:predicted kinase